MMLDLPPLSARLRQRAQAETASIRGRLERMRVAQLEPLLLSSWPPPKVGVQIKLVLTRQEALRTLRIDFVDPSDLQAFKHVAVPIFGERKDSALALESRIYMDYAALVLAKRHPDGRPCYTMSDAALHEILLPDGSPLNIAGRVAGCSDPDASLRAFYSLLHAWQELERRKIESNHERLERLRAGLTPQKSVRGPARL